MAKQLFDPCDVNSEKYISRNFFNAEKKISRDHAIAFNIQGNLGYDIEDNIAMENIKQLISNTRQRFKDYIQGALEDQIKKECTNSNITYQGQPITKLKNLGKAWAEDANIGDKVWKAVCGTFENAFDWDTNMEQEAMDCLNFKYIEEGNKKGTDRRGNKGCVAKLATKIKRDMLKSINRQGKKTHGIKVTVGRETVITGEDSKGRKKYQRHTKGSKNDDGFGFSPTKHLIQVSSMLTQCFKHYISLT